MLAAQLRSVLNSSKSPRLWFSLSLIFSLSYGLLALKQAFSSGYIVQDDARQHVFWMQRFIDPELFPNDLIADYFQSVAPAGYTAVYRLMAAIGVQPLVFNKLLQVVLGSIATGYCFGVSLQLFPLPATGFAASVLLNQALWMDDGLTSGTPRAFLYPILLAFLYYWLKQSLLPCLVAIALLGFFYPQSVFVSAGLLVLQLFRWKGGRLRLSACRRDYWFCAAGLGVALLVLLPYATATSQYGPTVTAAQAKTMPEFLAGGRASFFGQNSPEFWLEHPRGGLYPRRKDQPLLLGAGLLLPILFCFPNRLPLIQKVTKQASVLVQLPLVSLTLFIAAHILLFELHLPSRYTKHNLRIVLAFAAAIALTVLLDAVLAFCQHKRGVGRQGLAIASTAIVTIALVLYPAFLEKFLKTHYEVGAVPELYQFFAQQPRDSLIASTSKEADFLPTFSRRSILVGREYAIPYHMGYYSQFRERASDLLQAQYSANLTDAQNFIKKYGIDFWLLEEGVFTPEYLDEHRWLKQYQPAVQAQINLQQGVIPALAAVNKACSVFETNKIVVLGAECVAEAKTN